MLRDLASSRSRMRGRIKMVRVLARSPSRDACWSSMRNGQADLVGKRLRKIAGSRKTAVAVLAVMRRGPYVCDANLVVV